MILTSQRKTMVEELKKLKSHPTADEFYVIIKKKLPRISLGSVYRNLDVLSHQGLINKVETSGTQKRFDGDLKEHYHLRCSACGKVFDFSPKGSEGFSETLQSLKSVNSNISGFKVEFSGFCESCSFSNKSKSNTITA